MSVHVTSRGQTFTSDAVLNTETCASCGVLFAMPSHLMTKRREDGKTFYCPNGHDLTYGKSKAERLEQQLKWAREDRARAHADLDQTRAELRGQKARGTRFKNERDRERARVANGVCPCCNRSFENLARHMASQHPEHGTPQED